MKKNQCIKCKKDVWKGTKYYHNYWQLYCNACEVEEEKIFSECFNTVYSAAKTPKQLSEEIDILRRHINETAIH
jgi:hypothetical protein